MVNNVMVDKAKSYLELVDAKRELERMIKELKGPMDELSGEILDYLAQTGQKAANFANVGTFTRTQRSSVYLREAERACAFMFAGMKEADSKGEPLLNHLVTQARAHQSRMLEWARERLAEEGKDPSDPNELNEKLRSVGFSLELTDELHYARARA
jgi:hypothetical protein